MMIDEVSISGSLSHLKRLVVMFDNLRTDGFLLHMLKSLIYQHWLIAVGTYNTTYKLLLSLEDVLLISVLQ